MATVSTDFAYQCVAPYLNPKQLKYCKSDTSFIRQWGKKKSFIQTIQYVLHKCREGELWLKLVETGVLPRPHSSSDNTFLDSPFPDTTIIRFYWEKELSWKRTSKSSKTFKDCYLLCQSLVDTLPFKKKICQSCQWSIPVSDFHNDTTCTFCTDYDSYHLMTFQKAHYLKPNKPQ